MPEFAFKGARRTVAAKCIGTAPALYDETRGISFLFSGDELPKAQMSKVFWMDPNMSEKKKAMWVKVLTSLGFPPEGRSAEDWRNIGAFVSGTEVELVLEMQENGDEKILFINGGSQADPDDVAVSAATLFGGSIKLSAKKTPTQDDDDSIPF